jgi:hypothetical protein
MEDANVLRAIAVVMALAGFGAGLWLGPGAMRPVYCLLLGALLAGNLPQLAEEYVYLSASVKDVSSLISFILAAAGALMSILQRRRAHQGRRA